jgi:hypothetical protein
MSACQQGTKTTESGASAVDIPNTSVKSQGVIGYCWAYAAVAMIESDYKKRTGRDIDISEEAIGFFHFAEQLKATMDRNLKTNRKDFLLYQGGFINGTSNAMGSKDAFALIERWGLIPESQWTEKFETEIDRDVALDSIKENFLALQEKIRGKQTVVQMNQIFEILTDGAFTKVPPVDGFNNGSGQMNSVQYARNVVGFRPNAYQDVWIDRSNAASQLESSLQRVKQTLAAGNVVGLTISMPSTETWFQRIQGTRFVGLNQPFALKGAHAMVITDFKNSGGVFGPMPNVGEEVKKPIELELQFKLKNSWGSQAGVNEFGRVIQTGFYDMDLMYMTDVLKSGGYVAFTFPAN